ncbi:MAG: hypothetical protein K5886_13385 [Lachnospiraceae bacterium]|nr:hypothetical protein [Lachnospiraceae bacterium]
MTENIKNDNIKVQEAAGNRERKNTFISDERDHILHLTARILKRTVTDSDDEFSIALIAVSEAIDSYKAEKGNFWNYASLVIKSRILDEYRRNHSREAELLTDPSSFDGNIRDDDSMAEISIKAEISGKTAVYVDNTLKYEIEALSEELSAYDIDLFDLPKSAPKSSGTKKSCTDLILSFFLPPPLIALLRKTGKLPVKEMLERCNVSRKLIDRHRKFILASILIKDGDYQGISGFIS